MTIYDRIQEILIDSGLSEREFSVKIGHANRWLNNVLTSKSKICIEDVLAIEKEFGVNPMYLIKGLTPKYVRDRK